MRWPRHPRHREQLEQLLAELAEGLEALMLAEVGPARLVIERNGDDVPLTMTDKQKVTYMVEGGGTVTAWSVSDPTVLTITPAADLQSADVESITGVGGVASVQVTGTNVDGTPFANADGSQPLSDAITVEVEAPPVEETLVAGTPTDK